MAVLVDVFNTASVERGRPSDDTVDLVALGEQELGQIRAVLASNTYSQKMSNWITMGLREMGRGESHPHEHRRV